MSTSLIVITIALHSLFVVHENPGYMEAGEGCVIERTGQPTILVNGTCSDYVQALIDEHVKAHPDLPYNIVLNGNELNKV